MRGFTQAHKVCSDCPTCGGRLVTLPVLSEGLGAKGVSALTRAAREAPKGGCRCPSCGNAAGILKVEVDGRKIEIDVCDKCLSVWCDRGEFETLVPNRELEKDKTSLHDLAMRASPEARERLAKAMLEEVPEAVDDPADISLEDVVLDIVRLVVGAPTLWRTVRPVTPIFSILLTLALPIGQLMAFCAWHETELFRLYGRHRRFWVLDDAMVKAGGVVLPSSLGSAVTYPFLQTDGYFALILAFLLFPVFAILERKAGRIRFLVIIGILWLASIAAHAVQIVWGHRTVAYMCGIGPIALGAIAYLRQAYPNLRFQWMKGCNIASIYLFLVAMVLLTERCFGCLRVESYSFALLGLVSCSAVGAWLGRRKARRELIQQSCQADCRDLGTPKGRTPSVC